MKIKNTYEGIYACDFETHVEESTENQEETYIWAATFVELTEGAPVVIEENFEKFMNHITLKWPTGANIMLYFHNLKFDGSFILTQLLKEGREYVRYNVIMKNGKEYLDKSKMLKNQFNCSVSSLGAYYSISFKWNGVLVEVRDSMKLIPGSLAKLGKDFQTEHQKTEMEYFGNKTIYNISLEEKEYIENDVLVLKECLLKMFQEGHTKLTIGSCCMSEFRKMYTKENYKALFPDLTIHMVPELKISQYDYVRMSYRGGWCYVNRKIAGKTLYNGEVNDANSHYPSQMDCNNIFPIGIGKYYKAVNNEFPEECKKQMNMKYRYYFIRFKCFFKLKEGHFPFIQIKNNPYYSGREMLENSTILFKGKKYKSVTIGLETFEARPEMVLTKSDWVLFQESYEISELEIFDCLMFAGETGINLFHGYIEKYRKMKIQAGKEGKGSLKQIAKLFLNNLYGKFATSPESDFKIPYLNENGVLCFQTIQAKEKQAGYIPIGSAITSYARCVTVRLANSNYEHFAYADTDSVHLYNVPENYVLKGIKIDPLEFGCWARESRWKEARFLRAKTYTEFITESDGKPCEKIEIKSAGLTKTGKKEVEKLINEEGFESFKIGLTVENNLKPTMVKGGTLLVNKTFHIR